MHSSASTFKSKCSITLATNQTSFFVISYQNDAQSYQSLETRIVVKNSKNNIVFQSLYVPLNEKKKHQKYLANFVNRKWTFKPKVSKFQHLKPILSTY